MTTQPKHAEYDAAATKADDAFDYAIDTGRLSSDINNPLFPGSFLYVGHDKNGRPLFKNIPTRQYI